MSVSDVKFQEEPVHSPVRKMLAGKVELYCGCIVPSGLLLDCCMPLGILKPTRDMCNADTVMSCKEVRCLYAYQGACSIVSDVG